MPGGGMERGELDGILAFLRAAEQLKNVTRTAWTTDGHRESVAEHSWRLTLMALVLAPSFPDVDVARLLRICIVHDLGEAIGGDIPAIHQLADAPKAAGERESLLELLRPLPERLREEITSLWDEYEGAITREARLAKALDKLETILQHNQGLNPPDFDYRFNLQYGQRFTRGDAVIEQIRALLDAETERRAIEAGDPRASRQRTERPS